MLFIDWGMSEHAVAGKLRVRCTRKIRQVEAGCRMVVFPFVFNKISPIFVLLHTCCSSLSIDSLRKEVLGCHWEIREWSKHREVRFQIKYYIIARTLGKKMLYVFQEQEDHLTSDLCFFSAYFR